MWQHGADARFLSCAAREQFVGCVLCAPVACRCEYWTSQYVRLFTVSWHTKRARCSPALVSTLTLTWISENTPVCAACRNPAPSNERSPAGFVVVFWPEQAGAHGSALRSSVRQHIHAHDGLCQGLKHSEAKLRVSQRHGWLPQRLPHVRFCLISLCILPLGIMRGAGI